MSEARKRLEDEIRKELADCQQVKIGEIDPIHSPYKPWLEVSYVSGGKKYGGGLLLPQADETIERWLSSILAILRHCPPHVRKKKTS